MILRADLDFLLGCGGNNELNHIIRAMLQAKGKNGRKNNFADKKVQLISWMKPSDSETPGKVQPNYRYVVRF